MPNHTMLHFKCPEKITNTLDRECQKFLWGKDCKLVPVAWNRVCSSKDSGGFGIRKSSNFNNVCPPKLGWKFLMDSQN